MFSSRRTLRFPVKQLYRAVYRDIFATRRSAGPLHATLEDCYGELLLCEAIAESQRTGA